MKDLEFIELRNRFLLALLICVIFLVPFFLIFYRNITTENSKILKRINQEETFYIFLTKNNCKDCKEIEKKLQELSLDYLKSNQDKDKNYQKVLTKVEISNDDITLPTLFYIENGKLISILMDFDDENLHNFLTRQ